MATLNYQQVKRLLTIDKFKQISSYREIINLGIDAKWNQLTSTLPKDADVDPADIFDEDVALIQDLQYHGDLLTISLLSELWEQELYNYLSEHGHKPASDYYKHLNKAYNDFCGLDLDDNKTITQMREVVNAIKHGENSIALLKTKYPDEDLLTNAWVTIDENGNEIPKKIFDFNPNALTYHTLNLTGKFEEFQNGVIKFWEDLFAIEDSNAPQPKDE